MHWWITADFTMDEFLAPMESWHVSCSLWKTWIANFSLFCLLSVACSDAFFRSDAFILPLVSLYPFVFEDWLLAHIYFDSTAYFVLFPALWILCCSFFVVHNGYFRCFVSIRFRMLLSLYVSLMRLLLRLCWPIHVLFQCFVPLQILQRLFAVQLSW